ncbi:MAG: sulfite exporter TauE/SafE family protein [Cyanobacteria bacterium P01_G01_bin.67]
MLTVIVGHILAVGIGLSLGLIGGGGAILAVPILVYVMGLNPKVAIAMSLIIVCIISIIGVISHWQQGNIRWKIALTFIPAAMIGANLGSRLTRLPGITDTVQLIAFAVVMALVSILMIRRGRQVIPQTNKAPFWQSLPSWLTIPGEGVGVGILTGFVGVGGGFIIVPALVIIEEIPIRQAIGTSLVIIAASSTAGFLGYVNQVEINWQLVFTFVLAASSGTIAGSYINRYVDTKQLQQGFGYFILAVAIFVLIQQ